MSEPAGDDAARNASHGNAAADVCRAALLTPAGAGAIASIAVEGVGATAALERLFTPARGLAMSEAAIDRIMLGKWRRDDGPGEELVVCRRGPERWEVHCHGGGSAARAVLNSLSDVGFQTSPWRDVAHLWENDRLAADARIALAAAMTPRTAAVLLDQYRGALRDSLAQAVAQLTGGETQAAAEQLRGLLRWRALGAHLTKPWRVVLSGPVNVGKSSLINALLGYARSIVSRQSGTTRDVLAAATALDGWPIELTDTAGLREGGDSLEQQGMQAARKIARQADLVLLVRDFSRPTVASETLPAAESQRLLVVHNKCDLLSDEQQIALAQNQPSDALCSALTGWGVESLLARIVQRLIPETPPPGAAVPFLPAHIETISAALAEIEQSDLAAARKRLVLASRALLPEQSA